jgi:hypothetical protein
MDNHYDARHAMTDREALATKVEVWPSLKAAPAEFKLSRLSAAKWVGRYRQEVSRI